MTGSPTSAPSRVPAATAAGRPDTRLVVLRGNSASGKSSVAQDLQPCPAQKLHDVLVLIGQPGDLATDRNPSPTRRREAVNDYRRAHLSRVRLIRSRHAEGSGQFRAPFLAVPVRHSCKGAPGTAPPFHLAPFARLMPSTGRTP